MIKLIKKVINGKEVLVFVRTVEGTKNNTPSYSN